VPKYQRWVLFQFLHMSSARGRIANKSSIEDLHRFFEELDLGDMIPAKFEDSLEGVYLKSEAINRHAIALSVHIPYLDAAPSHLVNHDFEPGP
jgi:hypothetical protein